MIRFIKTPTFNANIFTPKLEEIINSWIARFKLSGFPQGTYNSQSYKGDNYINNSYYLNGFSFYVSSHAPSQRYLLKVGFDYHALNNEKRLELRQIFENNTYSLEEHLQEVDQMLDERNEQAIYNLLDGWWDGTPDEQIISRIQRAFTIPGDGFKGNLVQALSNVHEYFELFQEEIKVLRSQIIAQEYKEWVDSTIEVAEDEIAQAKKGEAAFQERMEIYTHEIRTDIGYYDLAFAQKALQDAGFKTAPLEAPYFWVHPNDYDDPLICSMEPERFQCTTQANVMLNFNLDQLDELLQLVNYMHTIYPVVVLLST